MSGSCARSRAVSMGFALCGQIELFALCVHFQVEEGMERERERRKREMGRTNGDGLGIYSLACKLVRS